MGTPEGRDADRALYAVAFTVFLDLVGFGIILPVLPYFAEELGASPAVVALLATAFSLAQLAMSPVLGRLSDRFGRRPVLLVSVAGSVVSSLILGFASSVVWVFASRVIAGMSKANVSTAHAYAADLVAPERRAAVMGRLGAAASMGLVVGPGIGGLLAVERMPTLPFLVTAGLSLVNLLLVWRWVPEIRARRRAPKATAQRSPVNEPEQGRYTAFVRLVTVNFLFFVGYASVQSTFALFTKRAFGWGSWETGHLLMLMGASMALTQGLAVKRVVLRFGEMGAALLGLVAFFVGAAALGASVAARSAVAVIVGSILMVIGVGLVQTSLSALVSSLARADEQGLKLGLRDASSALGRILGPIVGGLVFEAVGVAWPSVVAGAGALAGLVITIGMGDRARALVPLGSRAKATEP